MFSYILNFLRRNQLCLPDDFQEHERLLLEAEYFKIDPLVEILREMRRRSRDTVLLCMVRQGVGSVGHQKNFSKNNNNNSIGNNSNNNNNNNNNNSTSNDKTYNISSISNTKNNDDNNINNNNNNNNNNALCIAHFQSHHTYQTNHIPTEYNIYVNFLQSQGYSVLEGEQKIECTGEWMLNMLGKGFLNNPTTPYEKNVLGRFDSYEVWSR